MLRISKAFQGGFALIFLLVMISAVVRGFIKIFAGSNCLLQLSAVWYLQRALS